MADSGFEMRVIVYAFSENKFLFIFIIWKEPPVLALERSNCTFNFSDMGKSLETITFWFLKNMISC